MLKSFAQKVGKGITNLLGEILHKIIVYIAVYTILAIIFIYGFYLLTGFNPLTIFMFGR